MLSARAPELTEALARVADEGWSHLVLDGKVLDSDRCGQKGVSKKGRTIDAWYSGKTHDFGGKPGGHAPGRASRVDFSGRARLGP